MGRRCDVFCNVVDNYGDIGVAWRLSRQLAREHGLQVRLWLDDPASLGKLRPEFDPARDMQTLQGVEIRRWSASWGTEEPGEIVIETFSCGLPEPYLQAMARQARGPVWINLDYLSAEDWVAGCHGLPSPHPRLPLRCDFFYPGFTPGTGGLLREADLIGGRDGFQASTEDQHAFWHSLGLESPQGDELRVSLFAYDNPGIGELLTAWRDETRKITCLVPEGLPLRQVAAWRQAGKAEPLALEPGVHFECGPLCLHVLPFLAQDRYDRLLWACDLNFVRGEDSFVRAQWAARPMVWNIYPQDEGAHRVKLAAFLDRYCGDLTDPAAQAMRALHQAWNAGMDVGAAWSGFARQLPALRKHAGEWAEHLSRQGDLARNLVLFIKKKL